MELNIDNALYEMSLSRNDAIDRCVSLGDQFAKHFNKVMQEGTDSSDFKHHCHEMQVWYDAAKKITLKPKGKYLTLEYWIDWFFTAGRTVDDLIYPDYTDEYEQLIRSLVLGTSDKIEDIVRSIRN